jgi:hypothetical protein
MREQIGHRYKQGGSQSKQQYIPPLQPASQHRVGHYARFHPEDQPYLTGDIQQGLIVADELASEDVYDDVWPQRLPTSSRRYQSVPEVTTKHGRVNVVEHYHEQPLRAHRTSHQQLPPQRQRHTQDIEQIQPNRHRSFHPLVWIGVFCILLILGWTGLNFATSWYLGVQNDWTYGKQRHFEINAVVGHSDSATNPSHFTAENNNGQIIVIELPGNNVSKAKIYQIETVPGNSGNPPVKISFQDMNADGRADMLVQIGDGSATLYVTMFNNGTEFVSKL